MAATWQSPDPGASWSKAQGGLDVGVRVRKGAAREAATRGCCGGPGAPMSGMGYGCQMHKRGRELVLGSE